MTERRAAGDGRSANVRRGMADVVETINHQVSLIKERGLRQRLGDDDIKRLSLLGRALALISSEERHVARDVQKDVTSVSDEELAVLEKAALRVVKGEDTDGA